MEQQAPCPTPTTDDHQLNAVETKRAAIQEKKSYALSKGTYRTRCKATPSRGKPLHPPRPTSVNPGENVLKSLVHVCFVPHDP